MTAANAGIQAFREAYMSADTLNEVQFGSFDARQLRYQIFWSFYENSAYRDIHLWAKKFRADYGLYRYVRNIYNPAYRLGEFWRSHLQAGALDPAAGDGVSVPSALPIITDNQSLRDPIAQIWRWSNWQSRKETLSLWGSVLGDVFLRVIDDPAKQKVYLQITHPGTLKDITTDIFGNLKGYVIEEYWPDPNNSRQTVVYNEVAKRDGDYVVYETYLNGAPLKTHYDDNGKETYTWFEPYGFIPMVHIQHNDVGLGWGWSELHPELPKIREVDDLTSKLDDQIRKTVDAPWLLSGVKKDDIDKSTKPESGTTATPEAGRQRIPTIYGPAGSDAKPLVANLDIAATTGHIAGILKEIERDYPELTVDVNNATGDMSGRALRIHRQPVEDKVLMRRPNYDDAIIRALQMAISIGGMRGYFQGFDLTSYAAGNLDFSISERPVFKNDPQDDLDAEMALWTAAKAAKDAGIPLTIFLKRQGWSDEKIAEVTDAPEYKARLASLDAANRLADQLANPIPGNRPNPTNPDNQA
jgi:hypothetical protein